MFSQSITLEKEIERYRKERINLFYDQEATYHENQFMLMHMIPETFLDSSYNNPIYYFARKGTRFGELFSPFRCDIRLIPTAAGIRFANQEYGTECRLQNNGIAEIYCPLKDYIRITEEAPKGTLYTLSLWEDIERFVRAYAGKSSLLANSVRVFAGLSVVGCKEVKTDNGWPKAGSIERHILVCEPVVFEDMADSTRLKTPRKQRNLRLRYARIPANESPAARGTSSRRTLKSSRLSTRFRRRSASVPNVGRSCSPLAPRFRRRSGSSRQRLFFIGMSM